MAAFINYSSSYPNPNSASYTTTTSTGSYLTIDDLERFSDWTFVNADYLRYGNFKDKDLFQKKSQAYPMRNPNYTKARLLKEIEVVKDDSQAAFVPTSE